VAVQYQIKGQVRDGTYYSPDKNFSCPLPEFVKPGAVVLDKSVRVQGGIMGTVGFDGGEGELYRIEWFELDREKRIQLSETQMHRALLEGIRSHELQMFRSFSPRVIIEHEETTGEAEDARKFLVLYAAQGANIGEGSRRFDSTRGFLIFVKGAWIYALSIQDSAPFEGKAEATEVRNQRLKTELDRFANTLDFK
jgi:hypothetical protein